MSVIDVGNFIFGYKFYGIGIVFEFVYSYIFRDQYMEGIRNYLLMIERKGKGGGGGVQESKRENLSEDRIVNRNV